MVTRSKYLLLIKKNDIESILKMGCPELLDENHNKVTNPVDAEYDISFCTVDVAPIDFAEKLRKFDPTYIFISLGSDRLNIETAVAVRTLLKREAHSPIIQAVIKDATKQKSTLPIKSNDHELDTIEFIGEIPTVYSEGLFTDSLLVDKALNLHIQNNNGDESGFWGAEFHSSYCMSVIILEDIYNNLKMNSSFKIDENLLRNDESLNSVIENRHRNAYLRSEGWVYSGNNNKSTYSEPAKTHHLLVPYKQSTKDETFNKPFY